MAAYFVVNDTTLFNDRNYTTPRDVTRCCAIEQADP
jgi:hypothetical protein